MFCHRRAVVDVEAEEVADSTTGAEASCDDNASDGEDVSQGENASEHADDETYGFFRKPNRFTYSLGVFYVPETSQGLFLHLKPQTVRKTIL
jgi:hypothetical protein